jgi:hypothetical protein
MILYYSSSRWTGGDEHCNIVYRISDFISGNYFAEKES